MSQNLKKSQKKKRTIEINGKHLPLKITPGRFGDNIADNRHWPRTAIEEFRRVYQLKFKTTNIKSWVKVTPNQHRIRLVSARIKIKPFIDKVYVGLSLKRIHNQVAMNLHRKFFELTLLQNVFAPYDFNRYLYISRKRKLNK